MARYRFSQADRMAAKLKHDLHYLRVMIPARIIQAQQREVSRGGKMPVVSGDLRDSLVVDAGGLLLIGAEAYRELMGLPQFHGTVSWGWTVPYANRINYGFTGLDSMGRYYNQAGRHFIEYGEMLAPRIARDEARRMKAME